MSLTDHAIWRELAPFLRVETYDRDGGHAHPRHRIEALTPADAALATRFVDAVMPCVSCSALVHPVRVRAKKAGRLHLYVAVTCPITVRMGCARSRAATEEYDAIVARLERDRGDP